MILRDNIYLLILFIVFGLSASVQLFYYLFYYLSVWLHNHPQITSPAIPVSVILCARNEEENLRNFLPAILEQNYPDFEVIVVNDCSEDNTFEVLGELLKKYPQLKVSNISKDPKFTHNKRFAQFIGIKAAKNEYLLFTDADCRPESEKWLTGMVSHFDSKTDFILGYGGYLSKTGILNKYIRYDSMSIAMQYLGMALRGIPYMGVGRNLAYRRSLFFNNKGYGSHNHLISGDDDLFVNTIATKHNTLVEFRPETHTRSVPSQDLAEFFKQKKRHLTTSRYYKFRDKMLLLFEPASRTLFYISLIILLGCLYLWPFVLAIFLIRLITQITIFSLTGKRLNEPGLLGYSILFDIFSPLINLIVFLTSFRNNSGKNRWK